MSIRAAVYVRQSVEHAEGIQRQIERTNRLASDRGWTVVATFEDNGASAFKTRGPATGWGRMLSAAASGDFTHLIAVDLDRLVRGQADLLTLIESKLAVVTVDGELDLSTADGEFRASLAASLARFEVRRKSERQKRANAYRVSQGKPVPGKRRYGYETDGVTPRETEAEVVRRIFRHVLEGGSLYGLAKTLNEEGVPTGTKSSEWSTRRLRDTALIAAYGGQVRHTVDGITSITDSEHITPLVPREDAIAVRQIVQDPARRTSPGNKAVHLLSSIAQCAICGSVLTARAGRYNCRDTNGGHVSIKQDRLDGFTAIEVGTRFLEDAADEDAPTPKLQELLAESSALSERRTNATELLLVPGVDRTRLLKELTEVAARADEVTAAIVRERGTQASGGMAAEVRALWDEARDDESGVEDFIVFWQKVPLERQREIVRAWFKITVSRTSRRGEEADYERTSFEPL